MNVLPVEASLSEIAASLALIVEKLDQIENTLSK